MASKTKKEKGLTLIEVLVGTFLMLLVFLGIFGVYRTGIWVVGQSQNKITALSVANKEIEEIRNLPYSEVGVEGSFPDGVIPAEKTYEINGREYNIKTRIDYVVDSADGVSEPDDECPNDYKKIEVEVSWEGLFEGSASLVTDIAPDNMAQECAEAGGILFVSVFDAFAEMVPSPLIEIKDPETGQVLKTASESEHYFSLPPGNYRVVASKSGYSGSRSYGIDEIAIPEKPDPSVAEGGLSEISFAIDELSSMTIETLSAWGIDYFTDSFSDQSEVSESSNVVFSGGEVSLEEGSTSGYLISVPIFPADLLNWEKFSWDDLVTEQCEINYQVLYYDGENWILIPDSDLPGNSEGFISSVDLSALDVSLYPQLKIKGNLSTSESSISPLLYNWEVSWRNSEATVVSDVPFYFRGDKEIGKDSEENPVYKFEESTTSGGSGSVTYDSLEWDLYSFSVEGGWDLQNTEPAQPVSLSPAGTENVTLYVQSQNSFLIEVQDEETEEPVFSAEARLYKEGYDKTQQTNQDGQTYFAPLDTGTYSLEVSAGDYSGYSGTVSISGDETKVVYLERVE